MLRNALRLRIFARVVVDCNLDAQFGERPPQRGGIEIGNSLLRLQRWTANRAHPFTRLDVEHVLLEVELNFKRARSRYGMGEVLNPRVVTYSGACARSD